MMCSGYKRRLQESPTKLVRRSSLRMSRRGSALTEAVVSMIVFLPLFVVVPLIGKKMSMKHDTIEAGRYALWERTVWSGGGANQGTATKSNQELALEAQDRVAGDPDAPVVSPDTLQAQGVSRNPLWVDRRGDPLVVGPNGPGEGQNAETNAAGSVPDIGATGIAQSTAEQRFDLADGGLVEGGYAQLQRQAIEDWGSLDLSGREPGPNDGQLAGRNDLLQQAATGAILTNKWASADEQEFQDTVDEGVFDEETDLAEVGLNSTGPVPLGWCDVPLSGCTGNAVIGEAGYGADSIADDNGLIPESDTLPPRYVEDQN